MNKVYLLTGSNMGNSSEQLLNALLQINQQIGKVVRQSAVYVTAAWGNSNQPDFFNQVILVTTPLSAPQTLDAILAIEEKMGRIRTIKNAPRVIDIDILFFNSDTITTAKLTVPHPEIPNRRFVLVPMNELSPGYNHPVLQKNIEQLLADCADTLNVKKF